VGDTSINLFPVSKDIPPSSPSAREVFKGKLEVEAASRNITLPPDNGAYSRIISSLSALFVIPGSDKIIPGSDKREPTAINLALKAAQVSQMDQPDQKDILLLEADEASKRIVQMGELAFIAFKDIPRCHECRTNIVVRPPGLPGLPQIRNNRTGEYVPLNIPSALLEEEMKKLRELGLIEYDTPRHVQGFQNVSLTETGHMVARWLN
jgi:hypothetical protein